MFKATLTRLRCPECRGELALKSQETQASEVRTGSLLCKPCRAEYPILAGVAILVSDVEGYLAQHAKGISQSVGDSEVPPQFRKAYQSAKREVLKEQSLEHIEEDLESARVNALYLMNHYLKAPQVQIAGGSPVIQKLIDQYWDHGPFAEILKFLDKELKPAQKLNVLELGASVGGLLPALTTIKIAQLESYLGVDSSFAGVALARHLALGIETKNFSGLVPDDLLHGALSRKIEFPQHKNLSGKADFVVGDLENLPLAEKNADLVVALNTLDMMPEPEDLPKSQRALLKKGGVAIQSSPYVWHSTVARQLKERLPAKLKALGSAQAVQWLYEEAGLKTLQSLEHVPWLFYKHARQLEIYSVHLLISRAI